MEHFICLGTTLTNQNSVRKEIKSRLKSGNACCHSVQNVFSSSLLAKNIKIKIYRNILLPVALHGFETWPRSLTEESRRRLSENRMLIRMIGPKRDDIIGPWKRLHDEELNELYTHQIIKSDDRIEKNEMCGHGGRTGRDDKQRKEPLGRPMLRWDDNIKMDLQVGWRHGLV